MRLDECYDPSQSSNSHFGSLPTHSCLVWGIGLIIHCITSGWTLINSRFQLNLVISVLGRRCAPSDVAFLFWSMKGQPQQQRHPISLVTGYFQRPDRIPDSTGPVDAKDNGPLRGPKPKIWAALCHNTQKTQQHNSKFLQGGLNWFYCHRFYGTSLKTISTPLLEMQLINIIVRHSKEAEAFWSSAAAYPGLLTQHKFKMHRVVLVFHFTEKHRRKNFSDLLQR